MNAGDAEGMEKMIQLNLNTPMRLCHHLSKPMVDDKKGVIIDIASIVSCAQALPSLCLQLQ